MGEYNLVRKVLNKEWSWKEDKAQTKRDLHSIYAKSDLEEAVNLFRYMEKSEQIATIFFYSAGTACEVDAIRSAYSLDYNVAGLAVTAGACCWALSLWIDGWASKYAKKMMGDMERLRKDFPAL